MKPTINTESPVTAVGTVGIIPRLLLVALMTCCLVIQVHAAGKDETLAKEWEAALQPLRTMPVQDFGFVRSAFTFGENHLLAIADEHSHKGMSALQAVLRFMADPESARTTPLIKIIRPDLVQLFGAKRISVAQYRDPAMHPRLMQLISQNQEMWLKPINELESKAHHLEELENDFAIVPRQGEWLSPRQIKDTIPSKTYPFDQKIIEHWQALKHALTAEDPKAGGEAARNLTASVLAAAQQQGIELPQLRLDVFYHKYQPFAKSAFLYLLSALAYGTALVFSRRWVAWIGYGLLGLGFIAQVLGIIARWVLAGRAPLSNMYESLIFAIAGMVLVGIVFESVNKTQLVGLGSAVLGFIFMVLAHKAPIFDSQIRPLIPALQSSWLTYHVVTIMLSYSAFALACFISVTYLIKDALGGDTSSFSFIRRLPNLQTMDILNYKVIAVGFPLLTLGIVCGAVWAATAWGRPWGFDPKETWSAITWLIFAIYLHVRHLAGWKGRRAAILSLIGFAAVLFTYLGVNYLLPGLHSYV